MEARREAENGQAELTSSWTRPPPLVRQQPRQTFAVIEGPVEFRMGSPPGEPERDADETPHLRLIPRRFAIADKEVTVEQYQRFVKENRSSARRELSRQIQPRSQWSHDRRELVWRRRLLQLAQQAGGAARDQWCYLPNERREYDAGMTIPAGSFRRTGYRLPAEAEWEYACRAGAVTSRYHGLSIGLLEAYARYAANSKEHAWPAGSLLPNDLGLFDMLGNVYEWCQEREANYQPGTVESEHDDILDIRILVCFGAGRSTFLRRASARPTVTGSCRRPRPSTVFASPGLTTDDLRNRSTASSSTSRPIPGCSGARITPSRIENTSLLLRTLRPGDHCSSGSRGGDTSASSCHTDPRAKVAWSQHVIGADFAAQPPHDFAEPGADPGTEQLHRDTP